MLEIEMILDTLDNARLHFPVHPLFPAVFGWLAARDLSALPLGRTAIDGTSAYVAVSEYLTKSPAESFIECHEKYIDIQIVVSGVERLGICDKAACEQEAYDADKDLRKLRGRLDFVTLRPGYFAILFPQDGHMPGLTAGDRPASVRKIVAKVPV